MKFRAKNRQSICNLLSTFHANHTEVGNNRLSEKFCDKGFPKCPYITHIEYENLWKDSFVWTGEGILNYFKNQKWFTCDLPLAFRITYIWLLIVTLICKGLYYRLLNLYENILCWTSSFGRIARACEGNYAKTTSSTQYIPIQVQ